MPLVEDWDFNFEPLVYATVSQLLEELAYTHSKLAQTHDAIAEDKIAERSNPAIKDQRYRDEGNRDILIEKKFLILRLLEHAADV